MTLKRLIIDSLFLNVTNFEDAFPVFLMSYYPLSLVPCFTGLKDNDDEEKKLAVSRQMEVKNLPMEDTVWLIEELFTVPGRSKLI